MNIIELAKQAGWSGIYTQWREPDGSPDWTPVKESPTVPVTAEQIERFAALVRAEDEPLLRQALYLIEAWERGAHNKDYERDIYETSTAIKERLGESAK